MRNYQHFYIDGQWVEPVGGGEPFNVINPATEAVAGAIRLSGEADVEAAIAAARRAFASFSQTSLQERRTLIANICTVYERRLGEMAAAISEEMGAPLKQLSSAAQAPLGLWHFQTALVSLAQLFMLRERLANAEDCPLLSCQDIVTLLEFYLPKRNVTEAEVFRQMEFRHRKRQDDIDRHNRPKQ